MPRTPRRRRAQPPTPQPRRPRRFRPSFEPLEERVVPFRPFTHVAIGAAVLNDPLDPAHPGKVTLAGRLYAVPAPVVQALKDFPQFYRGGEVGPDAFPDIVFGQGVIHPEDTGLWLGHILDRAWAAQNDPQY